VTGGLGFHYGWKSNAELKDSFGHWNAPILNADRHNTEDVSAALALFLPPFTVFNQFWEWLREEKLGGRGDLLRLYCNQYVYGTSGYLHTDSTRLDEWSSILFVNETWDRHWAGATEIWSEDGQEIERAVMPRPGRLLTFPGNRWHRAAEVSRICPVARTVLVAKFRLLHLLRGRGASV
jgi:SM-20-related protein